MREHRTESAYRIVGLCPRCKDQIIEATVRSSNECPRCGEYVDIRNVLPSERAEEEGN